MSADRKKEFWFEVEANGEDFEDTDDRTVGVRIKHGNQQKSSRKVTRKRRKQDE